MSTAGGDWTTRKLLGWTTQHFEKHGLEAPRVQAEMLLAHVVGAERLRLYMEPDRVASEAEREALRGLVQRATEHEPVDYLVGMTTFFAMPFEVSSAVLIPRPSTETLVEHVLQTLRQSEQTDAALRLAEVGTGSGAVVVSLLKHLPQATAVATDISEAALEVAKKNAARHGVQDRVDFRCGDLLEPLKGEEGFEVLVSNPPYIPDPQWDAVEAKVKDHEPVLALRGGVDGLDFLRPLIAGAGEVLKPGVAGAELSGGKLPGGGEVALEIAAVQKDVVEALALEAGWSGVSVLADHEGLARVLVGVCGG